MTTVAEALSADRTAAALERIATALEQLVLEQVAKHDSQPGHDAFDHFHDKPQVGDPAPQYAAVPVVIPPAPRRPAGNCPQHHTEWKFVPPGVSRRTGQSYAGFWACSTPGCDQRPPR